MNIEQKTFGEILKRERANQSLSLRQLSEISDIEASYINRLEKGNRDNPGFSTVCSLAKALNLNGDEILQSFGFEQLGSNQASPISEVQSLIQSYVTANDNVNGYLPKIISLIEELRTQFQVAK
jgi:transcriptional regulator with XRE-family HTH domain